jgi:DNA modification methylase
MRRPMQNHVSADVYDPFAGSGTTLIAAEQLGRRCFAIEIEPVYVQVILDRWAAFTGQEPVQL